MQRIDRRPREILPTLGNLAAFPSTPAAAGEIRRSKASDAELALLSGRSTQIGGARRDPGVPTVGRPRRSGAPVLLGSAGPKERPIFLATDGRFLIEGRLPGVKAREARDALAIYGAAQIAAERKGLFDKIRMNGSLRNAAVDTLARVAQGSAGGRRSILRDKAFAGSMTLLFGLARRPEAETRKRALGAALQALDRITDQELGGFYFLSADRLRSKMTAEQEHLMDRIESKVLPKYALVEEFTQGRTRPLEVRHTIHPEFWREELRMFSKKNGWELVRKNADDTRREYRGLIQDPSGAKKPLRVHMIVNKSEFDYLEGMSDPRVHVMLYSGHSAVGGNGSQAIQAAGRMIGDHPKLVLAANCRGKDNYAEFTNKWPEAHVIMTEHPTYSESGQARIKALFEMLARGESYAWMRKETEAPYWDEPRNNYFYPDEKRKFRFMDADEDGRIDDSKIGVDALYNVDREVAGRKFVRALNFTNSELFYHWEVDHENGKRSHYGRNYGDSLIPCGAIKDPQPGEFIRVREVKVQGPRGRVASNYLVQYAPEIALGMNENVLTGHVTAHAVMALAKLRSGALSKKEALRAAMMGAQGVHYLDVYFETSPRVMRRYFSDVGLTHRMALDDVERTFEKYDAHVNDEQLEAFARLLTEKYGVDLTKWSPKLRGRDVVIDA